MFDESFRQRFQVVLRPIAMQVARSGITPNGVTIVTFTVAVVAALCIAFVHPVVGMAVWLVSRIGDGLDGTLARVTGRTSAFGGVLDITLDMAAYAAIVLAFSYVHPDHAMAWNAVLAGYVLVITTTLALSDAARAAGRSVSDTNRTFQFTPGITEAGETNVIYVVWALWPSAIGWTVWIWVAALVATSAQRLALARRAL